MRSDNAERMATEFVRRKRGHADADPDLWWRKYEEFGREPETWQLIAGLVTEVVAIAGLFVWAWCHRG
jgi:hypothetical protein